MPEMDKKLTNDRFCFRISVRLISQSTSAGTVLLQTSFSSFLLRFIRILTTNYHICRAIWMGFAAQDVWFKFLIRPPWTLKDWRCGFVSEYGGRKASNICSHACCGHNIQ